MLLVSATSILAATMIFGGTDSPGIEPKKTQKIFESVSGFDRLRGYTSGEKLVRDEGRTIGPGGTDESSSGK